MSDLGGGCHCGAVRFAVRVRAWDALDCNCSVCTKKGFLHLIVGADDFTLLAGEAALGCYTFGTHTAKHLFCRHCGREWEPITVCQVGAKVAVRLATATRLAKRGRAIARPCALLSLGTSLAPT